MSGTQKLLLIAFAGAMGTLARYGLSGFVQRFSERFSGGTFPWGTAAVNLIGCFCFGAVWMALESRLGWAEARVIILTGFMGAFTTFSTFMFESGDMIRDSQWVLALGNVLGQSVLGIVCLFIGLWVGKLI